MFQCTQCELRTIKWQGQCPQCRSWNALQSLEEPMPTGKGGWRLLSSSPPEPIAAHQLEFHAIQRYTTHAKELDELLGGGLVLGSVVLFGGNPGAGKSTLLLQVAAHLSQNHRVLYVSGEESLNQIALHLQRLQLASAQFDLIHETSVQRICKVYEKHQPEIMVVDSVQVLYSENAPGSPGTVSQVREAASAFTQLAKQTGVTILLVGHVTKEGTLAGPKVLEHLVDASLLLETTASSRYRTLRSQKNRFGKEQALGIFVMTEKGMREVHSPSAIFLSPQRSTLYPGSAVAALWEGQRCILLEIQALVDSFPNRPNAPRGLTVGLDPTRLHLLVAIVHRHSHFQLSQMDIFMNVVGGLQISDTSADLAIIAALISSLKEKVLPHSTAFFGEVGLNGEIRPVPHGESRVATAQKHGFKTIFLPKANEFKKKTESSSIQVIPVSHVKEFLEQLGF